jgi:cytochrome P450
MVTSDMPPAEKSTERLTQEAMVFFAAGSFTVWNNMVAISYYLLESPALKFRLQDELKDVMSEYPERIPHRSELEKIPYLAAVVKEGLR